jgi:hypothetical protein
MHDSRFQAESVRIQRGHYNRIESETNLAAMVEFEPRGNQKIEASDRIGVENILGINEN